MIFTVSIKFGVYVPECYLDCAAGALAGGYAGGTT